MNARTLRTIDRPNASAPGPRADVVIAGGGAMGCSVAHHLLALVPTLDVLVVERDPSYRTASSTLSASSIRQQFSSAVNVRLSQQSFAFLAEADRHLHVDGDEPVDVGLVERGYLYLASSAGEKAMRAAHAMQRANGADVELLDPETLRAEFPWLDATDVALASIGRSGEGWFDGWALLRALRRKARAQGARFATASVVGIDLHGAAGAEVVLDDGTRVACGAVVDAGGPHAATIARLAGVEIPVRPEPHAIFVFECESRVERCPLVIDPSGWYVRPEGARFIAGAPAHVASTVDGSLDVDHRVFDDVLWPALAARVPAFEAIRCTGAWAGHYDMNTFDQNALIGAWPDAPCLYLINGFSGHGLQQSPAAGRALAELIALGRHATLDVSELAPSRLQHGRAVRELNVV